MADMSIATSVGVPFWDEYVQIYDDPFFFNPPDAWCWGTYGPNKIHFPGLCTVEWRKHPKRVVQKKKTPATDGCNPKLLGFDFAEFDLVIVICTKLQLQRLSAMVRTVFPGKSPPVVYGPGGPQVGLDLSNVTKKGDTTPNPNAAFDVSHPALLVAGIYQVVVEGWTPLMPYNGKNDMKVCRFHCFEFKPSKDVKAQPLKAKTPPINSHLQPKSGAGTDPATAEAGPALTSLKKTGPNG